jgi:hypothetical protein
MNNLIGVCFQSPERRPFAEKFWLYSSYSDDTEANMERRDEEFVFMNGIDLITGVLNRTAEKLYNLAESLDEVSGEALEELNAGKTAEEIAEEDVITAEITAPLVNVLESISAVLNKATAEVCEMTAEMFDHCKETEV